jgi:hypothetical protein
MLLNGHHIHNHAYVVDDYRVIVKIVVRAAQKKMTIEKTRFYVDVEKCTELLLTALA